MPDESAIHAAGAQGTGALARALREARGQLGAHRAAALLRAAQAERRFGRSFTLLVVATFQPRAIEDALLLAFAIAGLSVEVRSADGFAALHRALQDPKDDLFDGIEMVFLPLIAPADEGLSRTAALLEAVRQRSLAPVLVVSAAGIGEADAALSGFDAIDVAVDGSAVDERFGRTFGAIPSAQAADRLADAASAHAARLKGTAPKLLVTDLDGTLWDGTLGEDGAATLRLDPRYAEALVALKSRGIVLAIASRNDPDDAEAAFVAHPEWPIARNDFAAAAIGWDAKAILVGDVLARLGLAPRHAVFVDDDPVNCASVAARFPEADVRLFRGGDDLAAMLTADPLLAGAGDAGARAEAYLRRDEVERLRAVTPDMAAFLRELDTRLTIVPLDPSIHARAAELLSRVNQFILTDRRPNALQLAARRSPFDFMVRLDDVFGAHGLVGLVLAHAEDGAVVVDNFGLSCRALGRSVEEAMLTTLADLARRHGRRAIGGRIESLPRNEPARKCFSRYGAGDDDGAWSIDANRRSELTHEGLTIRWEPTAT